MRRPFINISDHEDPIIREPVAVINGLPFWRWEDIPADQRRWHAHPQPPAQPQSQPDPQAEEEAARRQRRADAEAWAASAQPVAFHDEATGMDVEATPEVADHPRHADGSFMGFRVEIVPEAPICREWIGFHHVGQADTVTSATVEAWFRDWQENCE